MENSAKVKEPNKFEQIVNRVNLATERVETIKNGVRRCTDALSGGEPMDTKEEPKGVGGDHSIFATIGTALLQLEGAISDLEYQQNRLEREFL